MENDNEKKPFDRKDRVHAILFGVFFGLLLIFASANVGLMFVLRAGMHDVAESNASSSSTSAGEAIGNVAAVGALAIFYVIFYAIQYVWTALMIPGVVAGAVRIRKFQGGVRTYYIIGTVAYSVLLASSVVALSSMLFIL